MKSSVTKEFRKLLEALPKEVQKNAMKAYTLWRNDPFHPSLQFKIVNRKHKIYSVRIGIGYRFLGLQENDHIYWFWIGTHNEYDEILKRL